MTLEDAIRRARRGDVDAYAHVVRETATAVRAYLALHVRDRDAINDLAQETFLYAFRHLKDFTPGTDFGAYLKAIARTQALRAWRERQRKSSAHQRYVTALESRLSQGAEQWERDEPVEQLLPRLKECLARLAARARKLVELRYFEKLPLPEIAQKTGTSVNHVSVTLSRVRDRLAECMLRGEP